MPRPATARRDGCVRLRQEHRGRRARPAPGRAVRRRRRLPPGGQHRQDGGRQRAQRRRPRTVARRRSGPGSPTHPDGGVVTCSALKRRLPRPAAEHAPGVGSSTSGRSREVVARRQASRPGHFMPASLLDSQFATLEPSETDERGFVVDVAQSVDEIVEADCLPASTPTILAGETMTLPTPLVLAGRHRPDRARRLRRPARARRAARHRRDRRPDHRRQDPPVPRPDHRCARGRHRRRRRRSRTRSLSFTTGFGTPRPASAS